MKKITSDEAFKLVETVKRHETVRRKYLLEEVKMLELLRVSGGYIHVLGHDDAPFTELLADPTILLSRNTVYELNRTLEKLKALGVSENLVDLVNPSRVAILHQVIDEKNVEEWILKALNLSPQDFKDEIAKATGKVTSDEHKHNFEDYKICKVCGKKQHANS